MKHQLRNHLDGSLCTRKRHALEEEIKKPEERGLIEKSSSPLSSQVVMEEKKDGSWRMCVDYRKLNEKTIKDAYPLTRIDENLDTLDGADWYTSLDLDMAYHQVPMTDEDKEKTAFATPRGGLYQFTTMPFDLCNAASTFERLIEKALRGLQWRVAVPYLDDIVVFGKTWEQHFDNLAQVLERLAEAGLKLKPKKCNFLQKEVNVLEHIVSNPGVRTDPDKVKAVANIKSLVQLLR
jgi:predicted RNase H-like HicB family nuclease